MSQTETTQERQEPTKEEVISFLTESLEIAELRAKLQDCNTRIAAGRAEELKALVFISQITNPKPQEDLEEHIVNEEDITNNPELSEAGIKVGDVVQIPNEAKRKLSRKSSSPVTTE